MSEDEEIARSVAANGWHAISVTDCSPEFVYTCGLMTTFGHLFLGSAAPACPDAADADESGVLDLSDGVYTLGYLFLGTTAPPLPGPDACGPDVAADELGACFYAACP